MYGVVSGYWIFLYLEFHFRLSYPSPLHGNKTDRIQWCDFTAQHRITLLERFSSLKFSRLKLNYIEENFDFLVGFDLVYS